MYLLFIQMNKIIIYFKLFSPFIEVVGVTLISKITQVSGADFHTCTLYPVPCTVCSPPESVSVHRHLSLHPPLCSPPPPPTTSLAFPTVLSVSMSFSLFFFSFASFLYPSPPPHIPLTAASLLSLYESVSTSLVSPVSPLHATYEWNHMVLVSLWQAYFT